MCCLTPQAPSPLPVTQVSVRRFAAPLGRSGALSGAGPTTGAFREITRALARLGEMEPGRSCR